MSAGLELVEVTDTDLDHDDHRHGFCGDRYPLAKTPPEGLIVALCGATGLKARFHGTGDDCPACRQLDDLVRRGVIACPTCKRWRTGV